MISDNNETEDKVVKTMEDFFTEERASEGAKIMLRTPSGEETDHWLLLRGIDSEEFRMAQARFNRSAVAIASIEDEGVRERATMNGTRELIAVLIKDWSFEQPCTLENAIEFLRRAPQLESKIDRTVSDRALFFALASKSSTPSPGASSS